MNVFTKYNRKNIEDRQMDTLIGISKGINANGIVDLDEAKFLQTWLAQNTESQNPIILKISLVIFKKGKKTILTSLEYLKKCKINKDVIPKITKRETHLT